MTLRLVDSGFVPATDAETIAASARAFADLVESGEIEAERVIVCAVIDGLAQFTCFGPSPSIVEGVGLLELVKAKIVQGAFV